MCGSVVLDAQVQDLQCNGNHCNFKIWENGVTTKLNCYVFLLYEGLYDCSLLISLCTIMSHLTFSCISLCHTFSYTQDGATPLYMACQNGHKQTVDVLLKNGAIVNLTRTVSFIEETYGTWTERVIVLRMSGVCVCISFSSSNHQFSTTDGYLPLNTYRRWASDT